MSANATTVLLKKRERTQNWVPEEKNALFSLIKTHMAAIENKKIDAAASAMKTLAWQQIYTAFRGRFSTDRDITRMREQWRRMKAQARMEMYTFAEKLKNLGPEEAAKCRPSNLSIDVWRLMEKAKKSDGDGDRSDENSQEGSESSVSLQAILDKLPTSTPDPLVDEIKAEPESDDSHTEEECSQGKPVRERKRPRVSENEPIDLAEQRPRADNANPRRLDNVGESRSSSTSKDKIDQISNQEEAIRRTTWTLEVAQKEHDLKLKILNIDLERAELEKQTAINELKTSEIKRQLIENEAAEYYGQARMSGERGSGAGKGGGGGGSIREAGGSFGKMEAAHEDQYFYNLQKEQFQKLKEDLHDEISFHEEQIKRHQEAINRHKQRITNMTE
ncbi:uncharacterized protein LOC128887375 isoform X3 [Hylaeus anthracinus]|uniref:uncharacterized protein LOC128887375 isoform X3 n=1 Tax=Hylaeus anthracinus TaxID=313031 RepID=UPI0023B9B2CA|nr:uncharacterized protein LOC128887375 isoform X3 [Hylaeus anthracinus]